MMGWGYGMMGGWFGILIRLILITVIVYGIVRLSGHNHTGFICKRQNAPTF